MTLETFQKFIDEQHEFFRQTKKQTRKDRIFARTIKLGEEYGELCDEVLEYMHDQRPAKSKRHRSDDLGSEFADVLVVLFMLAKAMDVDVMKATEAKIKKLRRRYQKKKS